MNDVRQVDTATENATTDLPLQAQLMGSLALVFILSAIAGLVGYATVRQFHARCQCPREVDDVRVESHLAALRSVATMDPVLAEEAIAPLTSDRNVYGVAVYGPGGRRLAGHGHFPMTLVSGDEVKAQRRSSAAHAARHQHRRRRIRDICTWLSRRSTSRRHATARRNFPR
jgi:hypothetical protein